jgi:DNA primase
MSNEFKEIKDRILQDDRIPDLLEAMGCEREYIKQKSNRYEALLPPKFESDSPRSLQIYLNEHLTCNIRTRSVSGIDIFGLVSYIVYDCFTEEEQRKNLPKAKRFVCEALGYSEFLSGTFIKPITDELFSWLKDIKRKRNKKKIADYENEILDESILNQYIMYPHQLYINEGVEYQTQIEFEIGFDLASERIIFPIRNSCGELVSVKGRTTDPDYKIKNIPKFLYLYHFNMMLELYNWHKALYYIIEEKEIIIFEGEKTCWLSSQWGRRNCVAIGGSDLSPFQVEMIKRLGPEIRIVIALDKDKSVDDVKKQAKKFGQNRLLYAMWDGKNLLSKEEKNSPTDKGREVFEKLYSDRLMYKIN